jgi:hypothetical protein
MFEGRIDGAVRMLPIQPSKTVTTVLVLVALVGCSTPPPTTQIGEFAIATDELAEQATLAYQQIDVLTVQRKIVSVASVPGELPNDETFEGLLSEKQDRVRMELLDQLGSYAAALGELANADVRGDVDKAATNLYGSLGRLKTKFSEATREEDPVSGTNLSGRNLPGRSLPGRNLPLSDDSFALIATAIDAIGAQIVESKRRSAIKTVVIETNPAIQEVSALLSKELPKLGEFAELNIGTVETEMIDAYGREAGDLNFAQKVAQIEQIGRINQAKLTAADFFDAVGAGAGQVGVTHQALYDAVSEDRFTTKALVAQITELAAFAKTIKAFHKRLVAN